MKLIALTLPDEPKAMPGWLDQQLVGTELGQLIAELQTIHGSTAGGPDLETIMGEYSGRVLQLGLAALPRDRLTRLLRHPRLLLDLQDQVLVHGGHYWRTMAERFADGAMTANGLKKVQAVWSIPALADQTRKWYAHPAFVSFATAAAVLFAVYALDSNSFDRNRPGAQLAKAEGIGWGWAKAGAIPTTGTAKDYLNKLADGADEWSKKKPETVVAMGNRINEFRAGCTALIFAPHQPLNEMDRKWLVERCRVWGERLDKQLQALEGGKSLAEVQAGVDEIAANIAQSLRTRAESIT